MFGSPSQLGTENESIPSPNINTPLSSPLYTLRKPEELHPLTQNLSPSSPTLPLPSESTSKRLESPSATPDVTPIELPQSVVEE